MMWLVIVQLIVIGLMCNAFPQHARRPSMLPSDIKDLGNGGMKKAIRDVSDTISEVQKFLEKDPTLPRLTRGEIEELFEKVTKEEYEKSLRDGNMNRAVHMKSLMLVLPYNTNNYSDSMLEEFYTRPPITKIVNSDGKGSSPHQVLIQRTNAESLNLNPVKQKPGIVTTYKPYISAKTKFTTFKPLPTAVRNSIFPSLEMELNEGLTNPDVNANKYQSTKATFSTVSLPIQTETKAKPATLQKSNNSLPTQFVPPSGSAPPKLTPELQELLQSIGLLTDEKFPPHIAQEEFQPVNYPYQYKFNPSALTSPPELTRRKLNVGFTAPEVKPVDFETFKPLPRSNSDQVVDTELEELLKSYGILGSPKSRGKKNFNNDQAKSDDQNDRKQALTITESKKADLVVDADMVQGLTQLTSKFQRTAPLTSSALLIEAKSNKPWSGTKRSLADSNEDAYLNERLRLLTDDLEPVDGNKSFGGAAKYKRQSSESGENETSTTTESSAPFKLSLDVSGTSPPPPSSTSTMIVLAETVTPSNTTESAELNEDSSSADSETAAAEENEERSSASSTTTEDPDKFGALALDPVTEEPLPPPKKNGFYFFTDWNSFLEVGEEPDQVVVRFDPKVGDARRFIPIKIP